MTFDPNLDLKLERSVDVSPAQVWRAWTEPEHIVHWFVPKPWTVPRCEIDLRPGGRFFTVMRSPEGDENPSAGCFLEVVPERRLVWTTGLEPGFRPRPAPTAPDFHMTVSITLEPDRGGGTRYAAHVMHADAEAQARHEAMGFTDGWGTVLEQLVAYVTATL